VPTKKTTKPRRAARTTTRPAPRAVAARTPTARASKAMPVSAPAERAPRRAIFIDVENTSSEETLSEVLEALKIDRAAQPTELTAVGNWRAVGQRLARHLAALGAQLVHSAPALGVRDWSDLWIAVAAGCWLGQASPGDVLEIVSNDRAFDAVGDAAAARGVVYRRLMHRRGAVTAVAAAEPKPAARRSRGGRRRRRGGRAEQPPAAAAAARQPVHAQPAAHVAIEPHGATREQMVALIGRLTNGDPGRWVNLDVLEKALKAEGFARPPGSPRLVTRLRMIKEVEIDSHGRAHLAPGVTLSPAHRPEPPASATPEAAEAPAAPKRRRRRRSKPASASAEPAPAA
jgi:hypothetical protein